MSVLGNLARSTTLRVAMTVSGAGLTSITGHEALKQQGYLDSVGVATACIGHTRTAVVGKWYTREECDQLFRQDIKTFEDVVNKHVVVGLSQAQFDALVSFCFNVGGYNCRTSTLFALLNRGDYVGAAAQFDRWVYARKRDCRIRSNNCYGVVVRRAAEKELFLSGTVVSTNTPMWPIVASGAVK